MPKPVNRLISFFRSAHYKARTSNALTKELKKFIGRKVKVTFTDGLTKKRGKISFVLKGAEVYEHNKMGFHNSERFNIVILSNGRQKLNFVDGTEDDLVFQGITNLIHSVKPAD